MSDRIKETAQKELAAVQKLAKDGARSGAYLYPFKVTDQTCLQKRTRFDN